MIVFNVDLDNTLIYSYKYDIGKNKRQVELYKENYISYITDNTYNLLLTLRKNALIVPTTTRTIEQYNRIELGIGNLKYALVCNGGILLIDGKEDLEWYKESKEIIKESNNELLKAIDILNKDERRTLEVRFIKELFVFTKCDYPEEVVYELESRINTELVDVFNSGVKIYIVPKKLSKGNAVERFRKYIKARKVIVAGDSELDISMFGIADVAIAPRKLYTKCQLPIKTIVLPERKVYSEEVLEEVMNNLRKFKSIL